MMFLKYAARLRQDFKVFIRLSAHLSVNIIITNTTGRIFIKNKKMGLGPT